MHFGHFETSLRGGIRECAQMDPRFSNYSTTTMRLCGLRSFSSPLLGIGPGAGLPTPTQGPQGWNTPGAAGAVGPPLYGAMVPPAPVGWGPVSPMGLRGFMAGLYLSLEILTFRLE
jgi:hypothetical protein